MDAHLEMFRDIASSSIDTRRSFLNTLINTIPVDPDYVVFTLGRLIEATNNDLLTANGIVTIEKTNAYSTNGGVFPAEESLALLMNSPNRLKCFARAVANAEFPNASPVVDIGTGSSAILALVSAVKHPDSPVTAYEIDQRSSQVASNVVKFFGLQEQIQIINADFLQVVPQPAGMVVSETFMAGLLYEKGPILLRHANSAGVDALIPDTAKMFGKIAWDNWQPTGIVKFRDFNGQITGRVKPNSGPLIVRCDYYTKDGTELVIGGEDSDLICESNVVAIVSAVPLERKYSDFVFSYPVGYNPVSPNIDGFDLTAVSRVRQLD